MPKLRLIDPNIKMRGWPLFLATLIVLLHSSSLLAVDGLSVTAKHIHPGPGGIGTSAVFEIRNETDKSYGFLQITCAGFDSNQTPTEVGTDWLKNLTPHETAYGEVHFSSDEKRDIKSASMSRGHRRIDYALM
jgi:hypothetical protein